MKNKKVVYILLIVILMLSIHTVNVFATDSIINGADNFLNGGNQQILNNSAIKSVSNTIFNIFMSIGVAIVVIIAAILGIKFMVGSVEEKAEIKESIKPYVLGAVVIFAAVSIWAISVKIFQGIF